jgi:metabolite-proton symporter
MPKAPERSSQIMSVIRVSSGNFLEMYDFFVFAYYAAAIGKAFFPNTDPVASLLNTLAVFGVGFVMRPIGAFVLGAYIDHHGRRKGLILTLAIMSIGTISIALIPGYEVLGLFAPLLIVIGRLLQGFSAGVELGGVSVYLSEIATPGNKGFYVAWQSGSQQVAVIFVAVLGVVLADLIPIEQMNSWGWRIPFIIGCMIIPMIFLLRASLHETDEFLARKSHPTMSQIFKSVGENWVIVLLGMLMVLMTTVSFYLITAYTPTFGREVLHLSSHDTLVVTGCVGLSNLFWLPTMGALSDRIGRKPLLIVFTVLGVLTAYPALTWLVGNPSFTNLLIVELWLSFLYGSYNGAMVVYLTEIMPPQVRASGFSIAYSLATTLGGFTPFIATWLIRETGDKAIPGAWLSTAAVLSLIAVLLVKPYGAVTAAMPQAAE